MCTSITWKSDALYFGRNMDISFDFDRQVVITPRNYPIIFKEVDTLTSHYAIIGTAMVAKDYPLYCEAANEKGLYMAGLNFVNNAVFYKSKPDCNNISINEIILWILSKCASLSEVKELLENTNITDIPFLKGLTIPELHFMISDCSGSIVVECTSGGMQVFENKVGVLTNNPTFDKQIHNLNNYQHLSPYNPKNTFMADYSFDNYCVGLGALGLPGDFSSESRFVKSVFLKEYAKTSTNKMASIAQMFHMLDAVAMVKGAVYDSDNKVDYTIYSCCIDANEAVYYYKNYDSIQVEAVSMFNEDIDGKELMCYKHQDNKMFTSRN